MTYAQILGIFGHPGGIADALLDDRRSADGRDSSENEVDNVTLKLDWALGDNTLTAISGYMSYEFLEICDCDYTAAPVFTVLLDEEYEQFSQEVRLVSPGGEDVDWLVGAFYQSSDLDFVDSIDVPTNSVLGPLNQALVPLLGTFGPVRGVWPGHLEPERPMGADRGRALDYRGQGWFQGNQCPRHGHAPAVAAGSGPPGRGCLHRRIRYPKPTI